MPGYTNRSLDAAEVITELVRLAKKLREERDRARSSGYATMNSRQSPEDEEYRRRVLAHRIVDSTRRNATDHEGSTRP